MPHPTTPTPTSPPTPAPAPASPTTPATGRRGRKKARTRHALADAALRLFLERGYDQVSVKDVADAADVSVTTLFKHFPGKEALVFDREAERGAELVAAVRDRAPGRTVLDALHTHLRELLLAAHVSPGFRTFRELVDGTPALSEYAHRMWMRHETALAAALAEETGTTVDDVTVRALAHYVLAAPRPAGRGDDPGPAVDRIFALLKNGWDDIGA
ncbi:TetR/AcrR family transcriptional regulator [Streptomyces halobius]|uniref:TetR/AcrR family transcriptional regulator n=1 Tax=Streptomyces halobius TaxID=2879846 RepID=A0ABY4MG59_9ACTN|nr:TetR/AcrR family transcriptional regulator [Streptomyces halobius]UQA96770.1 TetR/AcrR family transcriptional regulator [Streptomyces halobius]